MQILILRTFNMRKTRYMFYECSQIINASLMILSQMVQWRAGEMVIETPESCYKQT